jgi:hypothetical protein
MEPAQAKLSWPFFTTPEDGKMWHSRARLFFSRAGEGACSTLPKEFFTVKPAPAFMGLGVEVSMRR